MQKIQSFAICGGVMALAAYGLAAGPALAFETQSYDLDGFTQVSASAGVDVIISVGGDYAVEVEQEDGDFEKLVLKVEGDTLVVSRKGGGWGLFGGNRPNYRATVSMPRLTSVDVSSGADVVAEGVSGGPMEIDSSSGADARVSGTCTTLEADASSGSDIDASDLVCENVTADVSSGADISVHATVSVSADASSGGDIVVYGNPGEVEMDSSSGGDVRLR